MSGFLSGLAARLSDFRAAQWRVPTGKMAQMGPRLMLLLLAALIIWQAVRLMWALAVPLSPLGNWQPQQANIMASGERISLFSSFDPFFRNAATSADAGAATVTSLGLTLFGINLNEATGGGSAIIAGEDGVQSSFAVGDEIAAGVTLAALAFDHVILERGGARESLFMDQSGDPAIAGGEADAAAAPLAVGARAAAPAEPVAGVTPGGEIAPDALKAGVRFAPRSEGGKVTGLTVLPQGDDAIFRAAGLRSGDVIRAINGRVISSAADAAGLAAAMRPGARLSLEVERGASRVPIALFLAKS